MPGLRRLVSESGIYSASAVATRVLGFLLVPIYARVFSPADFGSIGLINATLGGLTVLAILGLDSSAGRWFWQETNTDDRRATLSSWTASYFVTACLTGLALFAAAPALASVSQGSAQVMQSAIRVAALTIPLGVLGVVAINVFRVQRRPWAATAFAFVTGATTIVVSLITVVLLHGGITGVYVAQAASGVVASVIAVIMLRTWVRPRWFRWDRLKEMLGYALPLVPAAVAFWIVNLSDRYFVRAFGSAREVGLYQVANAVAALVALLTIGFQQAWGPYAFSIHEKPESRDLMARTLPLFVWIGGIIAAAVSVFAPEAIRIVATSRYEGAADAVPYLACSFVALGCTYIAAIGANLSKTTRPVAAAVGLAAVVSLILNVLLVPEWLGVGAGIATLVAWVVMAAYLFHRSQALYRIPYRFRAAVVIGVTSLAVAVAGESWQPSSLVISVLGKTALLVLLAAAGLVVGGFRRGPQQHSSPQTDREGSV